VQAEVAGVGYGLLATQDVGGGSGNGVVHGMGRYLKGQGEVSLLEAAASSRLQLLGPLAVLAGLSGEEGGQSRRGLLGRAEVPALVAHAGHR